MADTVGTPEDPKRAACEHCPDGHTDPRTVPWGVRLATEHHGRVIVDRGGQPTHLVVERTQGSHVAQSDADWLWQLIKEHGDPSATAIAAATLRDFADFMDRGPTFPLSPSLFSTMAREQADDFEAGHRG